MGKSAIRFGMGELKWHYRKKGPSAEQKKWKAIENLFESARECVKEYEMDQQSQRDAYRLIEHIKSGGEPY